MSLLITEGLGGPASEITLLITEGLGGAVVIPAVPDASIVLVIDPQGDTVIMVSADAIYPITLLQDAASALAVGEDAHFDLIDEETQPDVLLVLDPDAYVTIVLEDEL